MATLVVGVAMAGAGCGDDAGDADPPLVSEIAPAVEALEGELGSPPQYFEIRASPLAVTLWVSADQGRRAVPYVYADGELDDPDAAQEVDPGGFTFAAADALTFDPDHLFDQVTAELDRATLSEFSVLGGADGAIRLGVIARSERGGRLDVRLAPDGEVLEAIPID